GMPPQAWAEQTYQLSQFGTRDAMLVVAVDERAYWFEYGAVDSRTTDRIATQDIEPHLAEDEWAGAAIGAADGLERQGSGSGVSPGSMLNGIAVIIALVAALLLFSRRRRAAKTRKQIEDARDIPGDDTARLSALPVEVLDARARAGLVDADQAVEASASAPRTAAGELGEQRAPPFRSALDTPDAQLAAPPAPPPRP